VGWINTLTKLIQNLKLASPKLDPNKPWIPAENKILIKFKQALGDDWNNKNKTYKLIFYVVVRREEDNKIIQVWYKANF
jgi:hypothetical protein